MPRTNLTFNVALFGVIALGALLACPPTARAEKVSTPPAAMRTAATDIVVGEVVRIYERTRVEGSWRVTRYAAEVRVSSVEKGPEAGKLTTDRPAFVRYWRRSWVGAGPMPPSTNGHRGVPSEGDTVRVYAVRAGHNGFGTTSDGGLDVYGANGFEAMAGVAPAPSKR